MFSDLRGKLRGEIEKEILKVGGYTKGGFKIKVTRDIHIQS